MGTITASHQSCMFISYDPPAVKPTHIACSPFQGYDSVSCGREVGISLRRVEALDGLPYRGWRVQKQFNCFSMASTRPISRDRADPKQVPSALGGLCGLLLVQLEDGEYFFF